MKSPFELLFGPARHHVTVNMPDELHRQVERFCVLNGSEFPWAVPPYTTGHGKQSPKQSFVRWAIVHALREAERIVEYNKEK